MNTKIKLYIASTVAILLFIFAAAFCAYIAFFNGTHIRVEIVNMSGAELSPVAFTNGESAVLRGAHRATLPPQKEWSFRVPVNGNGRCRVAYGINGELYELELDDHALNQTRDYTITIAPPPNLAVTTRTGVVFRTADGTITTQARRIDELPTWVELAKNQAIIKF